MKATRYIILFAAAMLAACLTSCTPEEPVIEFPDSNEAKIASDGGSKTISFTTNYDWEATASDSWIQISPSSGKKGNATITITVGSNDDDKERKGNVTINSQTLKRSIAVSQAANFVQTLVITHENKTFAVPALSGNVKGKIDWGDGSEDFYSASAKHDYSTDGSHTVTIRMNGGTGFDLGALSGVTGIDISNF